MSDGEFLLEFLVESKENLDRLDRDLMELEREPKSDALLTSIFRSFHTLKGTSGFFNFEKVGGLTHAAEDLLDRLREGVCSYDSRIATLLLAVVDSVRVMIANIENCGDEGDDDISALKASLESAGTEAAAPAAADFKPPEPAALSPAPVADHANTNASHSQEASAVRVDVRLLDRLIDLAGELVLARNQLTKIGEKNHDPIFQSVRQRLDHLTSELHEGIAKTRMQPVHKVLSKLPRVVRDLAQSCGKQVAVVIEGGDTNLDRSMLEAIRDPLTHLVRNAIDHGIELPAKRTAAGKAAEGRLEIRAAQENGMANISITDDGAGIDPDRVKNKAIERGLITREEAAVMSEAEAMSIIFRAGFSTAEKVTSISGRGVGMDVVKTNIETIGGTVEIHSKIGFGSTIRIRIPLTLAIMPALIIRSGGRRFAIPQASLKELIRSGAERAAVKKHRVNGALVCELRDTLLPLLSLKDELQLDTTSPEELVVILENEGKRFGLLVEAIEDVEEIVVKPMGPLLRKLSIYSGATVLGDASIALILEVGELARRAAVELGATKNEPAATAEVAEDRKNSMLLFSVADRRIGVPLGEVHRLEELAPQSIEQIGPREVCQQENRIMPVVRLDRMLGLSGRGVDPKTGLFTVLICEHQGRAGALIVDAIVDIVEREPNASDAAPTPGPLSMAVVGGRVAELLDVGFVLDRALAGEAQTAALRAD